MSSFGGAQPTAWAVITQLLLAGSTDTAATPLADVFSLSRIAKEFS
jgi:hypothetical protein